MPPISMEYSGTHVWFQLWENVWFALERWAGSIWQRFCPRESASYWLDWLPAFCSRQRYAAQNRKTNQDSF